MLTQLILSFWDGNQNSSKDNKKLCGDNSFGTILNVNLFCCFCCCRCRRRRIIVAHLMKCD